MLDKEGLVKDIRFAFSALTTYLQMGGKLNLTDAHVQSESFVQDLLNAVYGWRLENTNQATANYPCIDLIDTTQKLGIQVSTDNSSDKINKTLACLSTHGLAGTITELKAFVLGKKQAQYTIKAPCAGVAFEWESDVLDFADVLMAGNNLPDARIRVVHRCVVDAMPDLFPHRHVAPAASQNEYRIRDHHGHVHSIVIDSCRWMAPAVKPLWIDSDPVRMSDPWIVAKFAEKVGLDLFLAEGWGDMGTWLLVDRRAKEGVVLNHDQLRELRQASATTTTSTTTTMVPPAVSVSPLPELAARILIAAVAGKQQKVYMSSTMHGLNVSAGDTAFLENSNDDRKNAAHLAAVRELANRGLIEDPWDKGQVYAVTDEGYTAADELEKHLLPDANLTPAEKLVQSEQIPILLAQGQGLFSFNSPPHGGNGPVAKYWRFSFTLVNGGPVPAVAVGCILDLSIAQHHGASAQLAMVPPGDDFNTRQARTVSFDVPEATLIEAFDTKQCDGQFVGTLRVGYRTPTGHVLEDQSIFSLERPGADFQFAKMITYDRKVIKGMRSFV